MQTPKSKLASFVYLKEQIKALKHSRFLAGRVAYQFLRPPWILAKLLTDGEYRSEHVTRWKFNRHYYQRSILTEPNRYPDLFAQCKTYLSTIKNPAILSFGCSTGEEVFTIGEYLPGAHIMGVDINEWCLKQCKKKSNNPRFSFQHRLSAGFATAGNFDAIFCMAVFQRNENRSNPDNNIAQGFTFEQFEQEILMLDNKLKPGGLFIIDNADFSFTDTACSKHYQPPRFEKNKLPRNRPLFDRHNRKVAETQNDYRMFIKTKLPNKPETPNP